MRSPCSTCSGSPGASSSLSSADAERLEKLQRRILSVTHFQAEQQVFEEFKYRDYEQKLQAEKQNWDLQLSNLQSSRAEVALRRKLQQQEVECRRRELDDHLAERSRSKVVEQDAQCQRRSDEMREAQRRKMEERRSEQLEKSKEMAGRLKSMDDQRRRVHEQKLQAEKEKDARFQEKEQQKAEARWQMLQIWAKSEELRKHASKMLAAGKHDELYLQLQEMRQEVFSPSPFSFPATPTASSPSTPGSTSGFTPPSRRVRKAGTGEKVSPNEGPFEFPTQRKEDDTLGDGTYDKLMNLFEAKAKANTRK